MKRAKISLIGGGQIGGNLALLVTQKELGDVVIYEIEKAEGVAKGKALDISQMLTHEGCDAKIIGTSNYEDIKNSDAIIITAGVPRSDGMSREDLLKINLNVITTVAENVKKYAPNAFVIVVSNPIDAIVYAFHKVSGFAKNKVVGMAGTLDSARFKLFIAQELNVSVEDITCMVLGGHGDTMVPISRLASVGGIPLTELISAKRLEEIEQRTRVGGGELVKLFGQGSAYYAPAQSAIEMLESYLKDKRRVIPATALCEGEFGVDGFFIGVPTLIDGTGISKIIEFALTDKEKKELDTTVAAVKTTVAETGL